MDNSACLASSLPTPLPQVSLFRYLNALPDLLMSLAQLVLSYLHIQGCYTPPTIFSSSFSPRFTGSNTAALSTAPKTSCLLFQIVFPLPRPCFHYSNHS